MTFAVRRLRATEAVPLRALRLRALADAPASFATTVAEAAARPPTWWEETATRWSEGDSHAMFIATLDDRWVGLVGAFRPEDRPSAIELVQMWSDPAWRRHGVATALVRAAVAWAEDVAASEVALWVMRGNEPALRLYERCGFARTDDVQALPSDPCKDEIRMVRRLAG